MLGQHLRQYYHLKECYRNTSVTILVNFFKIIYITKPLTAVQQNATTHFNSDKSSFNICKTSNTFKFHKKKQLTADEVNVIQYVLSLNLLSLV